MLEFKFAVREELIKEFPIEAKSLVPVKAEPKATGWDVACAEYYHIDKDGNRGILMEAGKLYLIKLGIRGFCPDGWWYRLVPRSSTFGKKHINCLYGTIDETYEGELLFAAKYVPQTGMPDILFIKFGEKIGQIIPEKRVDAEMVEVSNDELEKLYKERAGIRGAGGFGSTG